MDKKTTNITNTLTELEQKYMLNSKSQAYIKMLNHCQKVAKANVNILLIGESGSGKEIAARYIHACSNRNQESFIPVNCSAFTENLLESELFGFEKGSFTGASKSRKGRFEHAHKGTLFLDEVGDISLTNQVKLLRVLESKRVEPVGSNEDILVDFRLVSATNKDLRSAVLEESYREDFFYRISTIVIKVPSLRERIEDIPKLLEYFLTTAQIDNHIKITSIDKEVKEFLTSYSYPGNLREMKSIIERMVILSENGRITPDGIPILFSINKKLEPTLSKPMVIRPLREYKKEIEAEYILAAIRTCNNNIAETARTLKISERQLFSKIKEYSLREKM